MVIIAVLFLNIGHPGIALNEPANAAVNEKTADV